MKTVVTTLGSFPTGTEIADAVTGYGLALSRARTVDVVDIPFVAADGSAGRVELQIGWHSETIVVSGVQTAAGPSARSRSRSTRSSSLQAKTRAVNAQTCGDRTVLGAHGSGSARRARLGRADLAPRSS